MEIKIEDHLTGEEVKSIIAAEIREQTRHAFSSKILDPNTLLSNAGYYAVFAAVDDYLGESGYAQKQVEKETLRVLTGMDSYKVFGDRGSYPNYRPSVAQQIIDEATEANRDVIEAQVAERLADVSDRIGGDKINKFVADVVRDALDSLGDD